MSTRNPRWRWLPIAAAMAACTSATTIPVLDENDFTAARRRMVDSDLRGRGVRDARVLAAMGRVPRHRFVPPSLQAEAYDDRPLPIGEGQTISQPYIVALMTEQLELGGGGRVLEVGTGSGYQTAVLAELGCEVYSIEISPPLAEQARERLATLGYRAVHVRAGDGYFGWEEAAPFDAVIVTAAAPAVPPRLVEQLKEGGRMVLPVGADGMQTLMAGRKGPAGLRLEPVGAVRFVPMTGKVQTPS